MVHVLVILFCLSLKQALIVLLLCYLPCLILIFVFSHDFMIMTSVWPTHGRTNLLKADSTNHGSVGNMLIGLSTQHLMHTQLHIQICITLPRPIAVFVRLKNGESGETSDPKVVDIAENGKIPFKNMQKAFSGKQCLFWRSAFANLFAI